MIKLNEACCFWVILLPNFLKSQNIVLLNWCILQVSLTQEGVNDDCNEQIQEDLGDDYLKQDEENISTCWTSACERLSSVLLYLIIGLAFVALERDRMASREIKHDDVPVFAS